MWHRVVQTLLALWQILISCAFSPASAGQISQSTPRVVNQLQDVSASSALDDIGASLSLAKALLSGNSLVFGTSVSKALDGLPLTIYDSRGSKTFRSAKSGALVGNSRLPALQRFTFVLTLIRQIRFGSSPLIAQQLIGREVISEPCPDKNSVVQHFDIRAEPSTAVNVQTKPALPPADGDSPWPATRSASFALPSLVLHGALVLIESSAQAEANATTSRCLISIEIYHTVP